MRVSTRPSRFAYRSVPSCSSRTIGRSPPALGPRWSFRGSEDAGYPSSTSIPKTSASSPAEQSPSTAACGARIHPSAQPRPDESFRVLMGFPHGWPCVPRWGYSVGPYVSAMMSSAQDRRSIEPRGMGPRRVPRTAARLGRKAESLSRRRRVQSQDHEAGYQGKRGPSHAPGRADGRPWPRVTIARACRSPVRPELPSSARC